MAARDQMHGIACGRLSLYWQGKPDGACSISEEQIKYVEGEQDGRGRALDAHCVIRSSNIGRHLAQYTFGGNGWK